MVFKKGHKSGMTGKKHSKKTVEEMKNNNNSGWFSKGEHKSLETEFGNKDPWNKGKTGFKHSEKQKKKISEGIIKFYDEKGRVQISYSKLLRGRSKWKIWRELVFQRDNFTCQNPNCEFCNNKIGVLIHPHHIKSLALFPELAFRVDNGITYCEEFHLNSGLHKGIKQELSKRRVK